MSRHACAIADGRDQLILEAGDTLYLGAGSIYGRPHLFTKTPLSVLARRDGGEIGEMHPWRHARRRSPAHQ